MGNADKIIMRVDALLLDSDQLALMSSECRNEVKNGEPTENLSAKCSSEVVVIQENGNLVAGLAATDKECKFDEGDDHDVATKKCHDARIVEQRARLFMKIAEKQVTNICLSVFGNMIGPFGAPSLNTCLSLGVKYINSGEVDFYQMHGYDAGIEFNRGLKRLLDDSLSFPASTRQQMLVASLETLKSLYDLSFSPDRERVSFHVAVDQVGSRIRESAGKLKEFKQDIDSKRAYKNEAKTDKTNGAPSKVEKETKIVDTKKTVKKKSVKSSDRIVTERKIYDACKQLLDYYVKDSHPLYLAFKVEMPQIMWLYLPRYVEEKLTETISGLTDANLKKAVPSTVLSATLDYASSFLPPVLTDRIARYHYEELGMDFDDVDALAYTPHGFEYNGIYYTLTDLPEKVKPLAQIQVYMAKWLKLANKNAILSRAFQRAYSWLELGSQIAGLRSEEARLVGKQMGLNDIATIFEFVEQFYVSEDMVL